MNRLRLLFLMLLFSGFYAPSVSAVSYETSFIRITINDKGYIAEFQDKKERVNYLAEKQPAPLLSVRCNKLMEYPASLKSKDNLLILSFANNGIEVKIKPVNKKNYLTFEIVSVVPVEKVEMISWGPYPTIIRKSIGETIGVVHNEKFAVGIQALNIKTIGGYPVEENDNAVEYDLFDSTKTVTASETWKVNKHYRDNTAKPEKFGSVIQAYCRNRDSERIIPNWRHDFYTAPAYHDGGVIGSKIAIFGCPSSRVLEIMGLIETGEDLPHPLIDGKWCKIAPSATASYLIIDFDQGTLDESIELTKKAGLKYLYHSEPFETWGHFILDEKFFPENWETLKRNVEKAEAQGVHLGVHTLSNFITTNDSYVTPVPDKRFAKVGLSVLTEDIDEQTTDLFIQSPVFFNQMKNNNVFAVVIDEEIIRYKSVSSAEPWKLTGCVRGAFGTKATAHKQGDSIAKIMDHGYKTLLTNSDLSIEIAENIADLFNYTGIRQTSFDGLEGNHSTGLGRYGCQLFTKAWFDKLNPELKNDVINDASRPGHFNWHINTRYNWGEPWYAGFRESQQQSRLRNQDYFRRNFIPAMLGWFKMTSETSIEDTEWLLARAAGFDAGFSFCINLENARKNGQRDLILNTINQWETARMSGAFSATQKLLMENIENEFHLESGSKPGEWLLFPYHVQRYVYSQKNIQPGEPVSDQYEFENPYNAQPVAFILQLLPGEEGNASAVKTISMEINNKDAVKIQVDMEPFQILKADGNGRLQLYDRNWNLVRILDIDAGLTELSEGHNSIVFDAEFLNESSSKIKIEMKTIGPGEKIMKNNR